MSAPTQDRLFEAIEATWPPAAMRDAGPWRLREGQGGGKRVSAASPRGAWRDEDITIAEDAMRAMGQGPLFQLTGADAALDRRLEERGYRRVDPTILRLCPVERLTQTPLPRLTAFTIWEPLAIMSEIWAAGGIDAARQAVMQRCTAPKTALFGRSNDRPAGAGFCAIHDGIAMVHALEIAPDHRRQGLGAWMMRAAALWASAHGATHLAVLSTQANTGASALYGALGMAPAGGYHYRTMPLTEGLSP